MNKLETIAIIPARGGSKRIPNKNLEKIGDLTLVEHSIVAALCVIIDGEPAFDQIIVSSDSEKILKDVEYYADQHCRCSLHKRSPVAATDDASDRDVVLDVLKEWDARLIVYLRPTTPMRSIEAVAGAITRMREVPDITGLRSVHEMSESYHKAFVMYPGNILRTEFGLESVDYANNPNHYYPITYQPNGVVDIMRKSTLLLGMTYGDRVLGWITKPTIEIDTPHDLLMARLWHAYCEGQTEIIKTR